MDHRFRRSPDRGQPWPRILPALLCSVGFLLQVPSARANASADPEFAAAEPSRDIEDAAAGITAADGLGAVRTPVGALSIGVEAFAPDALASRHADDRLLDDAGPQRSRATVPGLRIELRF